jgi:hypothetical protein
MAMGEKDRSMSLAARIQELFSDRRREERSRVLIAAHLRTDKETIRSVLLNLSRTGAMMASVSPPVEGETVTLICEALEARGKVIWVKGFQFGLAFGRKLHEVQVAAIVALAGGKGSGR